MKIEIRVPPMGESITEAVVGNIIKQTGEMVAMDDELLELETDKVNQVIYAQKEGKVAWSVSPEETVQIDQVIGHIDTDAKGETPKKEEKAPAKEEAKEPPPQKEEKAPQPAPAAPSIAASGGIRESRQDFLQQVQTPMPSPAIAPQGMSAVPTGGRGETRRPMTKIRKVIAKRLVEAQQHAAMLTTFNEIDMSEVMALRNRYKDAFSEKHGCKLGFMSFFVKACVSALQALPDVNSRIDGEDIVHPNYYDIGIAVGTERGLVVPVLRNCETLSLADIEKQIVEYATKARKGGLTMDDLQGGSFTITNGGIYGSMLSTPILNPPQSGILGMHNIVKRPVAIGDKVEIRPIMYLALSYDHRIVDGKEAVTFLVHIKQVLEDPARFILDI